MSNLIAKLERFRGPITMLANAAVIVGSFVVALLFRFDFAPPAAEWGHFWRALPAVVAIYYGAFSLFRFTRGWWRYVGMGDFANALKATAVGALGTAAFVLATNRHFARSLIGLHALILLGLSLGLRVFVRSLRQRARQQEAGQPRKLLIVGAGDTGETLLREVRSSPRLPYRVVAFLDDDPKKQGAYINGVPVAGRSTDLAQAVERFGIEEIIVATPSATGDEMRRLVEICAKAELPFKIMPATWEVLHGHATLSAAREVDIAELLQRAPVELDLAGIGRVVAGKRVLVTGAAGSIGSEICRQILHFKPAELLCLDHDENALFFLERDLAPRVAPETKLQIVLADITEQLQLDALFAAKRPELVYHAAAHKHVPMIEANPVEGVRNNVFGTELVATLAGRYGAEAFLLISTDKAVNPSSIMGATKRMAEILIQTLPFDGTRYSAVRFGNVLGSQGSVVPIMKEQIAKGGPVTVTDPEMRRYFMTIPEAVQLVIQASALGGGDEVFMLDMGEPVKILDLARDLIRLSGLRPDVDVMIEFSGVRPGEKLYEELYLEVEAADRTTHEKILVAKHAPFDHTRFAQLLGELRAAVTQCDAAAVLRLVPRLVPEYKRQRAVGNVVPLPRRESARPQIQSNASEAER